MAVKLIYYPVDCSIRALIVYYFLIRLMDQKWTDVKGTIFVAVKLNVHTTGETSALWGAPRSQSAHRKLDHLAAEVLAKPQGI